MNLPFFSKKSRPESLIGDYFFALEITAWEVKSAIWSVINGKTQVLAVGISSQWDSQSEGSLIKACDASLSDASSKLDSSGKIQPEKVIFSVPHTWLENEKISPVRLQLLRHLTQELSLSAVGFVVTSEALVRYLHHQTGVPPTAILIDISTHQLDITLVRLGKNDGTQIVARSANVVADVIEGLTRFPQVDMYPSQILLLGDYTDIESIKQQLLAHPWQSPQTHLSFLHFPKIEVLPSDYSIRAVALSGGEEVARSIGLITSPSVPPPPAASDPQSDLPSPDASPLEPEPQPIPEIMEVSAAELGFSSSLHSLPPSRPPPSPVLPEITEEQYLTRTAASPRRPKLHFSPPHLPHFSFHFARWLYLLILLPIFAGIFAAYWYLPKATVTLTVSPKDVSRQFELTIDPKIVSLDAENSILPGTLLENTTSEEKSAPATGTKVIGDKATGSVTLINGTSNVKTFPSGTVITSSSGLKFVTDSSATVASASGTADPNSYKPGSTTVNVTASQIGSDSNLSAGTEFKVDAYSSLDYVAKNDTAFSGGSSRQVKAVSKSDITGLKNEIGSGLAESAKSELSSQVSSEMLLIPETLQTQNRQDEFDHEEGEQADQLTLRSSVKATAYAVSAADLQVLASSQLASQIPSGYEIDGTPQNTFTVKSSTSGKVVLVCSTSAVLVPVTDDTQIISQIVGSSPSKAKSYLSTLPGVTNITFSFRPPLPSFLLSLPHQAHNIGLIIQQSR